MRFRRTVGVAVSVVLAALVTDFGSQEPAVGAVAFDRSVVLSTPVTEVVEGDRFTVSARITTPRQAKRVTLQRWTVPLYYGEPHWEAVKSVKVRDRKRITFRRVATALNQERLRAVVSYSAGKPVRSKPVAVKVWRWIPLSEFQPYYETSGLIFGEATMNGRRFKGYGAAYYSRVGAWEGRFTPGRNCKGFRGVLGVADISADGSSALVKITADDELVYESPALTPGMDVPMEIGLPLAYRVGFQLVNTSPEDVYSWPMIGDPTMLCTGV